MKHIVLIVSSTLFVGLFWSCGGVAEDSEKLDDETSDVGFEDDTGQDPPLESEPDVEEHFEPHVNPGHCPQPLEGDALNPEPTCGPFATGTIEIDNPNNDIRLRRRATFTGIEPGPENWLIFESEMDELDRHEPIVRVFIPEGHSDEVAQQAFDPLIPRFDQMVLPQVGQEVLLSVTKWQSNNPYIWVEELDGTLIFAAGAVPDSPCRSNNLVPGKCDEAHLKFAPDQPPLRRCTRDSGEAESNWEEWPFFFQDCLLETRRTYRFDLEGHTFDVLSKYNGLMKVLDAADGVTHMSSALVFRPIQD